MRPAPLRPHAAFTTTHVVVPSTWGGFDFEAMARSLTAGTGTDVLVDGGAQATMTLKDSIAMARRA